jgi:VIT1/CCC1 family predicted Fe2+/Mn2+ transporter
MVNAATIGGACLLGGLFLLTSYLFNKRTSEALPVSVRLTVLALIVFGAVMRHFTGIGRIRSAAQTVLVGGLAVGATFWPAHLFSWSTP